jgi:hypothetical protein
MKGLNIIGRALDKSLTGIGVAFFALTHEGWNTEPSDGASLPGRDRRPRSTVHDYLDL